MEHILSNTTMRLLILDGKDPITERVDQQVCWVLTSHEARICGGQVPRTLIWKFPVHLRIAYKQRTEISPRVCWMRIIKNITTDITYNLWHKSQMLPEHVESSTAIPMTARSHVQAAGEVLQ